MLKSKYFGSRHFNSGSYCTHWIHNGWCVKYEFGVLASWYTKFTLVAEEGGFM